MGRMPNTYRITNDAAEDAEGRHIMRAYISDEKLVMYMEVGKKGRKDYKLVDEYIPIEAARKSGLVSALKVTKTRDTFGVDAMCHIDANGKLVAMTL